MNHRNVLFTAIILSLALCGIALKTNFLSDKTFAQSTMAMTDTLPGAKPFDRDLLNRMAERHRDNQESYTPRTRHIRTDGRARYTNRLFLETSPYLIQHAHNPVNWYPWGDEAFAAASRLNRPVLLSVGYSTCHWCHVMEEESFEDEDIARYLNSNYVAIKVDREERPDIDSVYMQAVQAMTGRGGWPMNVWLTPDRQPFFGGTYFPAKDGDRGTAIGFLTLLKRVKEAYENQPDRVSSTGQQLTRFLRQNMNPMAGKHLPDAQVLHKAATSFKNRFDLVNGGIQGAPKFPSTLPIRFLLRYYRRTGDNSALEMTVLTLSKMARGGIHDQVGGGFHRYTTDESWLVPHFEKMLYDNALLALAYLDAYQVTGHEAFKAIVDDILNYVRREMTNPAGGFHSATDADSLSPDGQRHEGYYFTWTLDELQNALGDQRAELFSRYYGASAKGNFEGRNILFGPNSADIIAETYDMELSTLVQTMDRARQDLYQARLGRPAPLKDDKILTAWNALMISAFAQAGFVLDNPDYVKQAAKAANFLLDHLYRNKILLRSFRGKYAKQPAFLEDYAFFIAGLLDLYEADGSPQWLERAVELDAILASNFEDKSNGGFFRTGTSHETLIAREKTDHDSAIPSGNSIAIFNLLRLSGLTFQESYRQRAEKALKAFAPLLRKQPGSLAQMLLAVDYYLDAPKEIVIVTQPNQKDKAQPFLSALRKTFVPNRILIVTSEGRELITHSRRVPWVRGKTTIKGKPSAYVCEKGLCKLPTSDPQEFVRQIKQVKSLKKEFPNAS